MSKTKRTEQPTLLVYGASGHAKVVIDVVERQGLYRIECMVDDDPGLIGGEVFDYPVIGGSDDDLAAHRGKAFLVAIGDNRARAAIFARLDMADFEAAAAAIHPSAQIGRGAIVGAGTVVMAGAVINPDTRIGHNVIVNSNATVEHDCEIGASVHLSPGSTLCGGVTVGEGSLVGAGATVHPNIRIGCNVIVGAGATVLDHVGDDLVVAGTPARELPV